MQMKNQPIYFNYACKQLKWQYMNTYLANVRSYPCSIITVITDKPYGKQHLDHDDGVPNNSQYSTPVISVPVLNMIHWLLCLSNAIAILLLLMKENYSPSERQMKNPDKKDEKTRTVRLSLQSEIWPNEKRVIVLTGQALI